MSTRAPAPGTLVHWVPGMTIESVEQQIVQAAFQFYRGVKTTTATSLGISVRTLEAKLDQYAKELEERKAISERQAAAAKQQLHDARFGRAPAAPQPSTRGEGTSAPASEGLRAQSAADAAAKQSVPMSEREKIQGVLSRQATTSSDRGRR